MKDAVLQLSRFMRLLSRFSLWAAGSGLVAMTFMVAWQIYGRFILNDTPTWTETTSVLVVGWFILMGAAVGIREGNHLSFDIILYLIGPKTRAVFYTISDTVVIAFSIGMVVYGAQLAEKTWGSTIPNLGVSGGLVFLPLIWGGVLMTLFSVERNLRRFVGLPTARFGETELGDA